MAPLSIHGPEMVFDLSGEHARYAYLLPDGLVTPRPIARGTTQEKEDRVKAAPFSFFNLFGTDPPIPGSVPGDREPGLPKNTGRNVRDTGGFIVNLVDEACTHAMKLTSASVPAGEEKLRSQI